MPPPLLPRLQTSPPTRTEAAAGLLAAAQAGPQTPTRRPLDHDAPPAPRGRRRRGTEGDPHCLPSPRRRRTARPRLRRNAPPPPRRPTPRLDGRVLADDLPALHSLVSGLRRDFDAVTAGLSMPWSSGQVEGHVTRVKLIKRMAYGRANLDLLRQRVLLGPCPCDITRSPTEPNCVIADTHCPACPRTGHGPRLRGDLALEYRSH